MSGWGCRRACCPETSSKKQKTTANLKAENLKTTAGTANLHLKADLTQIDEEFQPKPAEVGKHGCILKSDPDKKGLIYLDLFSGTGRIGSAGCSVGH